MQSSLFLFIIFAAGVGAAEPVIVEAETSPGGDARVVVVADALAGKVIEQDKAWNPLFAYAIKAGTPRFTVWARHRNGPVQLKTTLTAGGQAEIGWSWAGGATWTWAKLGEIEPAAISGLIIIRGDASGGPATQLDQVVLDEKGAWKP